VTSTVGFEQPDDGVSQRLTEGRQASARAFWIRKIGPPGGSPPPVRRAWTAVS